MPARVAIVASRWIAGTSLRGGRQRVVLLSGGGNRLSLTGLRGFAATATPICKHAGHGIARAIPVAPNES
jgi:hypothetical protein